MPGPTATNVDPPQVTPFKYTPPLTGTFRSVHVTPSGDVRIAPSPTATNRLPDHATSLSEAVEPGALRSVHKTPSGEVPITRLPGTGTAPPTATNCDPSQVMPSRRHSSGTARTFHLSPSAEVSTPQPTAANWLPDHAMPDSSSPGVLRRVHVTPGPPLGASDRASTFACG